MGVSANLDPMRDIGTGLQNLVGEALIAPQRFGEGGPLSKEVSRPHDSMAMAALSFARDVDTGTNAAGDGLKRIVRGYGDHDGQNAKAFPRRTR